jgi:hypothetical protein
MMPDITGFWILVSSHPHPPPPRAISEVEEVEAKLFEVFRDKSTSLTYLTCPACLHQPCDRLCQCYGPTDSVSVRHFSIIFPLHSLIVGIEMWEAVIFAGSILNFIQLCCKRHNYHWIPPKKMVRLSVCLSPSPYGDIRRYGTSLQCLVHRIWYIRPLCFTIINVSCR